MTRLVIDASVLFSGIASVPGSSPHALILDALAKTSNAQAIVTGDRDMLDDAAIQSLAIDARSACVLLGLAQPANAESPDAPRGSTS